jgi:hypothetical protein
MQGFAASKLVANPFSFVDSVAGWLQATFTRFDTNF